VPNRRLPREARPGRASAPVRPQGFEPGTPVLLYLHSPREKVFGLLVSLEPAGIAVRGIDLAAFEDWLRQEARGETGLGLVTLFYPMNRVERVERDETVGDLEGIADRFRRETGRTVLEAAGLSSRRRRR
jgi:hypothetical protein